MLKSPLPVLLLSLQETEISLKHPSVLLCCVSSEVLCVSIDQPLSSSMVIIIALLEAMT